MFLFFSYRMQLKGDDILSFIKFSSENDPSESTPLYLQKKPVSFQTPQLLFMQTNRSFLQRLILFSP